MLIAVGDLVARVEHFQKASRSIARGEILTLGVGFPFLASRQRIDIVVTDYEMPEMDGEQVAASIKEMNPRIPVIMFSGSTLVPARARRVVDGFCDKAGSRDQILTTIHRLLHRKHGSMLQPPPPLEASHDERRTVA